MHRVGTCLDTSDGAEVDVLDTVWGDVNGRTTSAIDERRDEDRLDCVTDTGRVDFCIQQNNKNHLHHGGSGVQVSSTGEEGR